jgi:integrase/recombinase XerD
MKTYLDAGEIDKLQGTATNLRDKLLIRLLFHLGCRVSEALALSVEDIDFSRGLITIQHLKARTKFSCPKCKTRLSRSHTFCPGCGAEVKEAVTTALEHRKVRTLPIDSDTLQLLQEYIKRGGPIEHGGKKCLFGINRHRAWQVVKECAERAGLPKVVNPETGKVHNISPHRLRDAFAVHAIKTDDSGDGLRLLQEHLGHVSFNTTARYRKVAGEESREWYDGLWRKESESNGS